MPIWKLRTWSLTLTLWLYLGEEIIDDRVVEDGSDSVSGQAVAVGRSRGLSKPVAEEEP